MKTTMKKKYWKRCDVRVKRKGEGKIRDGIKCIKVIK